MMGEEEKGKKGEANAEAYEERETMYEKNGLEREVEKK